MNNQWNKLVTGALTLALPLVLAAGAMAQTWVSSSGNAIQPAESNYQANPEYFRAHTVTLNQQGSIQGRIATIDAQTRSTSGLSQLNIFFIRDGQIAYQAQSTDDGSFVIPSVAQGPYSFVATGPTGFAAYGIYVMPNNGQNQMNIMEAAAVSPQVSGIQQILNANLPTQVTQQIMQTASLNSAQPAQVTGSNTVRLVNGQLHGQVVSLFGQGEYVRGTIVNLIQNGRRVAEVQVDENGQYTIPDLQPGVYDFIAVGHNGLAAIRFEAVGQDAPMTQVAFSRTPTLISTTLDVCLTCAHDNSMVDQTVDYAVDGQGYAEQPIEYAGEYIGTGGAAGGSCGCAGNYSGYNNVYGYGGGFRGRFRGGSGRILALGGLAGGIIAISDPDDQSPNN